MSLDVRIPVQCCKALDLALLIAQVVSQNKDKIHEHGKTGNPSRVWTLNTSLCTSSSLSI
jgi:hypothetical protein